MPRIPSSHRRFNTTQFCCPSRRRKNRRRGRFEDSSDYGSTRTRTRLSSCRDLAIVEIAEALTTPSSTSKSRNSRHPLLPHQSPCR
ncbi:hypothetical protein M0R45_020089 [Rubus argutus]|uniref:Uncharacterized protein n=1 Tax=Rubus argutus TaxID=59490 RepID=A0AAW1XAP3_RUBAR